MIILKCLFAGNPFFESFSHADILGKFIFMGLLILSVITWAIIIHKVRMAKRVKGLADHFRDAFHKQAQQPLSVEYRYRLHREFPHPFYELYKVLRKHTLEILSKNRSFAKNAHITLPEGSSYLCPSDIELVESHLSTAINSHTQILEKNLFILSTVVTLAPFLGLLGTVWGILTTFSELQTQSISNTNQVVLHGLSLALATTVLGLIDAIPALVGYNYLKNAILGFRREMESFANKILSVVELHYRKVDTI